MLLIEKQLAVSMLCSMSNAVSEKLDKELLRYMISGNQQHLHIEIFSPDQLIRDFLREILDFQGYHCTTIGDLQDIVDNVTPSVKHVVFLDGLYLVGPESESALNRMQLLSQAGVHLFVMADRRWDIDLVAIESTCRLQMLWKPLDYRQVGKMMAQM